MNILKKKTKIAVSIATSLLFVTIVGGSIMAKNNTSILNIDNNSKKEININKKDEKQGKDKNQNKSKNQNENVDKDKIGGENEKGNTNNKDFNKEKIELNNIEEVNNFAKKAYKDYFSMDFTKDESFRFDVEEKTLDETSEKLWFCSWMGTYEGKDIYLNILINKKDGRIKKIDKYDYSEQESDNTIMDDDAKKIALDFVNKVNKEKVEFIGDSKIVKNSKDGYKVIFPKKNGKGSENKDIMIVAVNPYSGTVNSFTDLWN